LVYCELDGVKLKVAKVKHICVTLSNSTLVEQFVDPPITSMNVNGAMLTTTFYLFASFFYALKLFEVNMLFVEFPCVWKKMYTRSYHARKGNNTDNCHYFGYLMYASPNMTTIKNEALLCKDTPTMELKSTKASRNTLAT
jgi:hypothetical protein